MLETYPNTKKLDKIFEPKSDEKDSESKIIDKNSKKKGKKSKKKSKKNKKGLKKLVEIEVKEEKVTKFSLGQIKYAEIHKQATKPLRQLQDLTEEETKNFTCPCCGLPSQISGKLEPYTLCDNPDDFSNCGQGVALYYSFIKFVIIVTLVATIGISCLNIYYAYKYTYELRKVCNNYYFNNHNEIESLNLLNISKCRFYFTEADKNSNYSNLIDSYFFQFSLPNVKDYRIVFKEINKEQSNDDFESTIVNLSFTNFLCLIIIFAINLVYIYFLFNKSNAADYLVFTVSDYAIFLTNLYDIYGKFQHNLELVKKKEKEAKEKKEKTEKKYYIDKLGFEPNDKMSQLDLFKTFLSKKIFRYKDKAKKTQYYDINRIDICYKLEKIVELQKKLDELDEKIQKIEFDPYVNEKNKQKNLEGNQRNFYSNFLGLSCCCEKEESLSDIIKEKEKIEKEINDLIKDSKENTSAHFGGAAFITFNSIKQQEDYLSKLPSNIFDYFIKFFQNIFYLFCSCCTKKDSLNYYKRHIRFEAAPEPEDVIFENLETKPFQRIINTFIVYLVSLIICFGSLVAILWLNKLQTKIDNNNKENKTTHTVLLYVISFGITGVTSAIDIVLEIVLEILTKWEKQTTWTNFYLSYSLKLTLFSFVNSAVLPIICELLITKSEGYELLISNMLMKFLVNSFVTTTMWSVNVGCVLKLIRQYLIEKKDKMPYNQKELNEIYELPPMNVAAKYSYIGKTLLMSFLYVPIFPFGLGISLLGFILGYWLEKYNFANMYKKPEMLNRQIAEFYSNYFVLVFFVYGIGDYIFLSDAYEKRTWSLVNIIVFGVLIILPYNQLLNIDYLKFDESQIHEKEYKDKYVDFLNDYERANPMTKKEGEIRYLEQLEKKHKINKNEAEKRKQIIKEENPLKFYGGQIINQNIRGINEFLYNRESGRINDFLINPIGVQDKDTKNSGGTNMNLLGNESDNNINSNLYINQGKSNNNIFSNMKYNGDG